MNLLSSKELVVAIKQRQARQVADLKRRGIQPKLAIILTVDHPAIQAYTRMKKNYGADLGAEVDIHTVSQNEVPDLITKLNADKNVHAIIVQLPVERPEETEALVSLVVPRKDVDGLGPKPDFEPATQSYEALILEYLETLRGEQKQECFNGDDEGKHTELALAQSPKLSFTLFA